MKADFFLACCEMFFTSSFGSQGLWGKIEVGFLKMSIFIFEISLFGQKGVESCNWKKTVPFKIKLCRICLYMSTHTVMSRFGKEDVSRSKMPWKITSLTFFPSEQTGYMFITLSAAAAAAAVSSFFLIWVYLFFLDLFQQVHQESHSESSDVITVYNQSFWPG